MTPVKQFGKLAFDKGGDCLTPLCKKDYLYNVIGIVVMLIEIPLYVMFILNLDRDIFGRIFILFFTALLMCQLIENVYWIFQPNVLIYQYDHGIIINRNIKIEYKAIEKVYRKNYLVKATRSRGGNYYHSPYIGTIFIKLKSGKMYKIKNACNPLDVVASISRMKQQRKFR